MRAPKRSLLLRSDVMLCFFRKKKKIQRALCIARLICRFFALLCLGLCVACVCIGCLDVSVGAFYIKRGKPFFVKAEARVYSVSEPEAELTLLHLICIFSKLRIMHKPSGSQVQWVMCSRPICFKLLKLVAAGDCNQFGSRRPKYLLISSVSNLAGGGQSSSNTASILSCCSTPICCT